MEKTVSIELVYSREDNDVLPLSEGAGWIDTFVHFFSAMYRQLAGYQPQINYCDPGCLKSAHEGVKGTVRMIIAGKHLMNWEDGRWLASEETSVAEDGHSEIIVFKSYFPKIELVRRNCHSIVYEFFKANGEEYLNFYDKLDNGHLMRNLGDIAYEVFSLVENGATVPDDLPASRPRVFITESPDLHSEKSNLKRELEHLGYDVVSPVFSSATKRKLKAMCSDHSIFINLIGKQLSIDEKTNRTVIEWLIDEQLRGVKEGHSNDSGNAIGVYTWLCPEIAKLKRSKWNGHRAVLSKIESTDEIELITGSFEDFKSFLGSKLSHDSNPENSVGAIIPDGTPPKSVYFIHDKKDQPAAIPYIDYLRASGFTVYSPTFDDDILTARQLHDECLKRFDVVIILALNVNTQWVNVKMVDVLKARGMGRDKPVMGKLLITEQEIELNVLSHARQFEFMAHKDTKENFSNLAIYLNQMASR